MHCLFSLLLLLIIITILYFYVYFYFYCYYYHLNCFIYPVLFCYILLYLILFNLIAFFHLDLVILVINQYLNILIFFLAIPFSQFIYFNWSMIYVWSHHWFIYSLSHLVIHLFTHSFFHSLNHSFIHSFTQFHLICWIQNYLN